MVNHPGGATFISLSEYILTEKT